MPPIRGRGQQKTLTKTYRNVFTSSLYIASVKAAGSNQPLTANPSSTQESVLLFPNLSDTSIEGEHPPLSTETYLAFDLGAESGRTVAGSFDGERLSLREVHRFANEPVLAGGTLHWDVLRLYLEIKRGLAKACSEARHSGTEVASLGIDAWAVDFGLLGRDGALLGLPRHYRDHGNDGILEKAFEIVPKERIYRRTGIQFLQFNTLYQLLALKQHGSPLLDSAETLLFLPDLFHYWLTGAKTTEYSMASSSQFCDPHPRTWASDLLSAFGLSPSLPPPILEAGEEVGRLTSAAAEELSLPRLKVIAPAEHDTGSAIVAVPAENPHFAYISSGTWSLVGIETPVPLITEETLAHNFTNEGGVLGTNRLLKNVMGLWLVQECRRAWTSAGSPYDYAELTRLAEDAAGFVSLVEPDSSRFFAPVSMPDALGEFCRETGQPVPETPGAFVRCSLESLALKYRWTIEKLEFLRNEAIQTVHIVGGGSQNRLLCQFTANALERPVVAGPVEATAAGNLLLQMKGKDRLRSLSEARDVVRRSFSLETYWPEPQSASAWQRGYERFLELRERPLSENSKT